MLTTKNAGEKKGRKGEDILLEGRKVENLFFGNLSRFLFPLSPERHLSPALSPTSWRRGGWSRGLIAVPGFNLRNLFCGIFCVLLAVALTGCKPPGPRALLAGKELIEHGQYAEAVERLKSATSLMSTNAQAWNYLGLAYHQSGDANDAADAYRKALALDQNLVEVHYNLGCLWLEQNRADLAKAELTAYTLHRGDNAPEGWIKLGEAQLALRDFAGAEKSLNQARQFDGQNPEALNDLGVIQMQHNKPSEAAGYFNSALKAKPDYAPAILNLAIVSQSHLNSRQYALDRYHDYLALKPRPANWEAVDATARALEQELNGVSSAPVVATRPPAPTNAAPSTASRPTAARTAPPKPEQSAANNSRANASNANGPVEVVQVAPEPVIRGVPDTSPSASQPVNSNGEAGTSADHRGFFSRVNPVNLFRSPKSNESGGTTVQPSTTPPPVAAVPEPKPIVYPRYHYHSLKKPAAGDRDAAQKAFADGEQARQAGRLAEAAAAYRRAAQADPAYFEAYYNLGVVSVQAGNAAQALAAYEGALAIQPDSHDARFNFALALRQGNYPVDAAQEFEKLLAKSPNDVNAQYAVGSIYAQQLREPAKAREHYERVLALNPNFPQAAAVHDWLWTNPK